MLTAAAVFVMAQRSVYSGAGPAIGGRAFRHTRRSGMETFSPLVRSTNWQALALSAAIPLIVAAGLAYAAVQPLWEDDSGDWAFGLLALIPLEFVRSLVMTILGDSFKNYHSPGYAVNYFLLSLGILAVLLLGFTAYMLGIRGFVETMASAHTWTLILPVAAVIVADGIIALYFFRGDPGCQAARLEAAADDAGDLLGLALYPTPLLLGAAYGIVFALKQNGHAFAAWLPDFSVEGLRAAALLYGACYFAAKALIVAHVNTESFNRSGRRLLGGGWVGFLQMRKEEERINDLRKEQQRATQRRNALGLDDFRH
jgi:hypothetical protein